MSLLLLEFRCFAVFMHGGNLDLPRPVHDSSAEPSRSRPSGSREIENLDARYTVEADKLMPKNKNIIDWSEVQDGRDCQVCTPCVA